MSNNRLLRYKIQRIRRQAAEKGVEKVTAYLPAGMERETATWLVEHLLTQSASRSAITSRLTEYGPVLNDGCVLFAVGSEAFDVTPLIDTQIETQHIESGRIHTAPLLQTALMPSQSVWLVHITRGKAVIGVPESGGIQKIKTVSRLVRPQHGKGGASAPRFERLINNQLHDLFSKTTDALVSAAEKRGDSPIDTLVVGGTMPTTDKFVGSLPDRIYSQCIIKQTEVDTASKDSLKQLLSKSRQDIFEHEKQNMRASLEEYRKQASKNAPVVATEEKVKKAINYHAVETLLYGAWHRPKNIDILSTEVHDQGGKTVPVTPDCDLGHWFATHTPAGMAAILRFPIS